MQTKIKETCIVHPVFLSLNLLILAHEKISVNFFLTIMGLNGTIHDIFFESSSSRFNTKVRGEM